MLRIEAPHFVAGVILNRRAIVTEAAPILQYMMGWSRDRVIGYCYRKKWKCYPVEEPK